MARLTRQEMKRDEVREGFELVFVWLQEHGRQVLAGLVAAVALGLAVAGWLAWESSRTAAAQARLAEAIRVAAAPLAGEGEAGDLVFPDRESRRQRAAELFREVVEEFDGRPAATVARLHLADYAAAEGRPEEARELWTRVAEEAGGDLLAAQAEANRIALDREEGRHEEVEERLREMLDAEDPPLPEATLLAELATTLEELDRGEEARRILERLADEFPRSPYAAEAQRKLREMDDAAPGGPGLPQPDLAQGVGSGS